MRRTCGSQLRLAAFSLQMAAAEPGETLRPKQLIPTDMAVSTPWEQHTSMAPKSLGWVVRLRLVSVGSECDRTAGTTGFPMSSCAAGAGSITGHGGRSKRGCSPVLPGRRGGGPARCSRSMGRLVAMTASTGQATFVIAVFGRLLHFSLVPPGQ